ncbi:MAG: hypothetical protein KAI73_02300, partial [Rhodospirillaceae bacterium]|nr:hypothetical protein [Rhodospirillaceae bacterium]
PQAAPQRKQTTPPPTKATKPPVVPGLPQAPTPTTPPTPGLPSWEMTRAYFASVRKNESSPNEFASAFKISVLAAIQKLENFVALGKLQLVDPGSHLRGALYYWQPPAPKAKLPPGDFNTLVDSTLIKLAPITAPDLFKALPAHPDASALRVLVRLEHLASIGQAGRETRTTWPDLWHVGTVAPTAPKALHTLEDKRTLYGDDDTPTMQGVFSAPAAHVLLPLAVKIDTAPGQTHRAAKFGVVTVERKISDGNYGSLSAHVSFEVDGGATLEDISAVLAKLEEILIAARDASKATPKP